MKLLKEYDKESIVSKELIEEIFADEDEVERSYKIADCSIRAKELGVMEIFKRLIKERQRIEKEVSKTKDSRPQHGNTTDFPVPVDVDWNNMRCGSWFANETGVYSYNVMGLEQRACHHPILPIRRLSNIETGEEKITLTFRRDFRWKEITVDKEIISSASKIVGLSKYGVSVTSENAKYLVRYLNDVENMNNDQIEVNESTSKLGWHGTDFIPYDNSIIFDGDSKFKQIFESITEHGDRDAWYEHVLEIRRRGRLEPRVMLAASFASVLIKPLGILPFFVDLWGATEGGKSVALMLACSVWANPDESQYIGDYKTTDVALEVRADMLNNLPVLLDDTSNATKRIVEDFENIVYRLCSGKGKSRSNKELGAVRDNHWKTCFITNGERELSSYTNQGGAMNRIIEVEAGANIFEDPAKTSTILKCNYGFAGKEFIENLKLWKQDDLRKIYDIMVKRCMSDEKTQKQAMSMGCILLADWIIESLLFHDRVLLTEEEIKSLMTDKNELSEGQRCYQYLVDQVAMNAFRFEPNCPTEKWGMIKDDYAVFFPTVFDKLCRAAGFSKKAFLSWAKMNGLVLVDESGDLKVTKIDGKCYRAISIKITQGDGFSSEEGEENPFDD